MLCCLCLTLKTHVFVCPLPVMGPSAGTAVASAYIEDIARFQAHRFVGGIAPIASICRVSSAATRLLAIPRQQLYKHNNNGEPHVAVETVVPLVLCNVSVVIGPCIA